MDAVSGTDGCVGSEVLRFETDVGRECVRIQSQVELETRFLSSTYGLDRCCEVKGSIEHER